MRRTDGKVDLETLHRLGEDSVNRLLANVRRNANAASITLTNSKRGVIAQNTRAT